MKEIKKKIDDLNLTISKKEKDEYKSIFKDISDILKALSAKVEE